MLGDDGEVLDDGDDGGVGIDGVDGVEVDDGCDGVEGEDVDDGGDGIDGVDGDDVDEGGVGGVGSDMLLWLAQAPRASVTARTAGRLGFISISGLPVCTGVTGYRGNYSPDRASESCKYV